MPIPVAEDLHRSLLVLLAFVVCLCHLVVYAIAACSMGYLALRHKNKLRTLALTALAFISGVVMFRLQTPASYTGATNVILYGPWRLRLVQAAVLISYSTPLDLLFISLLLIFAAYAYRQRAFAQMNLPLFTLGNCSYC